MLVAAEVRSDMGTKRTRAGPCLVSQKAMDHVPPVDNCTQSHAASVAPLPRWMNDHVVAASSNIRVYCTVLTSNNFLYTPNQSCYRSMTGIAWYLQQLLIY